MSARADSLQAHPYAQTTQRKPLRSKSIICSAVIPRQENFEEETMQSSSKLLDQQILEKFASLTEENKMQVLAMLTIILSGGAA